MDFFKRNGQPGQRFRTVVEKVGWEDLAKSVAEAILA